MAFAIEAGESVARGIRRIVRQQVDKALVGLGGRAEGDVEEVVHDARKRFKKVRAVVRLARAGLGRKVAGRENARFRDAGRPLSAVRDAGVLVATLDKLAASGGDPAALAALGPARDLLVRRQEAVRREVLDAADVRPGLVATLTTARRDAKGWEVDGDGWDALGPGLGRIYRQGARARRAATDAPTDEHLHEWRKRVKDLWYALTILRPIRPAALDGRIDLAHALADRLGDDHDLAVLLATLDGPGGLPPGDPALAAVRPLVAARRAELRRDAFALGPGLYAERPAEFDARCRAYWRAWRAAAVADRFDAPPAGDGVDPAPGPA